jgi:hypothetical protein
VYKAGRENNLTIPGKEPTIACTGVMGETWVVRKIYFLARRYLRVTSSQKPTAYPGVHTFGANGCRESMFQDVSPRTPLIFASL